MGGATANNIPPNLRGPQAAGNGNNNPQNAANTQANYRRPR